MRLMYDIPNDMQILRVRLKHPNVPPEDLARLDPDFAAFMECRDPQLKQGKGV
jgi:hypothetical protein